MGDVATSAPVLESLSQKYNNDLKIVMLTPKFYRPFFFKTPNLEFHNIDLHNRHKGIIGIWRLYRELIKNYKFDCIIDLNRKLFSRLLCRFFKLGGTPRFSIDKGRKEKKALARDKNKILVQLETSINRYCEVFVKAGIEVSVPNQLPALSRRALPEFAAKIIAKHREQLDVELADSQTGVKLLGISPFAKHKGKTLPLDTIRGVIEDITAKNPDVLIFIFGGGKLEKLVAESFVAWYPNVYSAIGMCNLEQEMDLMSNLNVMLSMDSSAMHICSLLGVQVVSIWGATHRFAGFLGLGQSVEDIVEVELGCRPCSIYGNKECKYKDNRCMQMICSSTIAKRLDYHLNYCPTSPHLYLSIHSQ